MSRTAMARSWAIGLAAILIAPLVCIQGASAQDPPRVRIRGTIERVDAANCVVKARVAARRQPQRRRGAYLSGIYARHRRGTLSVGSAAAEYDDQSQSRAGRQCGRRLNVDAEIQRRGKEDQCPRQCADRDLRAGRQE